MAIERTKKTTTRRALLRALRAREARRRRETRAKPGKTCAGRVARVSYLNHHGERDPFEDRKLCVERLVPAGHWSPLEHVAMSMGKDEWNDHVMRTILSQTAADDGDGPREGLLSGTGLFNPMALGNLVGWLQYRKCFDHESGFDFDWQNMPDPYRIEQAG